MIFDLFQYMQKFDLAPVFSKEEFRHWFIPRENIVDSYVVEVGSLKFQKFLHYT